MKMKHINLKKLLEDKGMTGTGYELVPDELLGKAPAEQEIKADLILQKGKEIILQADPAETEDRGLVIKWLKKGGYDVYYWYGSPKKAVPSELEADGVSKGKSVKKVYIGYHPEMDDK